MIKTKAQYLDFVRNANAEAIDDNYLSHFVNSVDWKSLIEDDSRLNNLADSATIPYFVEQLKLACTEIDRVMLESAMSIEELRSPAVNPLLYMRDHARVHRINEIKNLAAKIQAARNSKEIFVNLYYTVLQCFARLRLDHPSSIQVNSGHLTREKAIDRIKTIISKDLFNNTRLFYSMNPESCCSIHVKFTQDPNEAAFVVRQSGSELYTLIYNLNEQMFV